MPFLAEISRRFHGGDADDVLDLVLDLQRTGGRQVDLVHHGDDLQPGVNGKVGIGQRLGPPMPCEASTTSTAPSQAASDRETS